MTLRVSLGRGQMQFIRLVELGLDLLRASVHKSRNTIIDFR
jgi:hypothetical protein